MPLVFTTLFSTPDDPLADMPLAQLKIIRHLQEGATTASQLSVKFKLSKPAISQMIRRLSKRKMLTQVSHPGDARVKILSLSEKAVTLMDERARTRAHHAQCLLNKMPAQDVARLHESLDQCAKMLT